VDEEPDELIQQLQQLYERAEAAASEGLADEAIKRCETALDLLEEYGEPTTQYTPADFLMIAGHACWTEGDIEGAERYYRQALDMDPGRLDALVAVGVSLFHLCRFSAAQGMLELATVEDPEGAEAWYYLGLCALRRDNADLAGLFIRRAHDLEPERWPKPKFLPLAEIEAILESVLERMPEPLLKALAQVAILVEDRPTELFLHTQEPPLDPLLLGFFEGVPLPEKGSMGSATTPDRILLFAENIALIASDHDKLVEELEITLKHEIGHFLGLDEDDLEARGLA
jgi:predicted Zn-dependent protease with MMP-like domain